MEKFQPNLKFYKKNYEGYTSNDEFDAKKRVQITNEVPPMDMFDMAHSLLKNDLWKWFFGYSFIINDVTYNEKTDGVETLNKYGEIEDYSVAKYVNGIRAKDYGPVPKKKWNPNYKRDYQEYLDFIKDDPTVEDTFTEDDFKYNVDYSERGRHIEIDGTLLPEVDLMLHEAYRYLSVLYPDHPDYINLLTTNEFEDDIQQAASIIDYIPDQNFFNWLSLRLDYSSLKNESDDIKDDAILQEAAKLKIRNLTNHAFRRKLFGAKTGYEMFGSDIFQHVSVFQAAQYVPYKELPNDVVDNDNPYILNFKWLRAFEDMPEEFRDSASRPVDKDHVLYKRKFRLIDWTNESYNFPERWVEPAKYYGTAWPTPYSQFILYEYPLQKVIDEKDYEELKDGLSTTRTIKNEFKPGQKINIGGQDNGWSEYQTGHIAAIREEPTYKVEINTATKETIVHENPNTLTVVDVDIPVNPFYSEFEIWPGNEELIETIRKYENKIYLCEKDRKPVLYSKRIPKSIFYEKENRFDDYINCDNLKDATEELHKEFYKKDILKKLKDGKIDYRNKIIGKFTPDPHQDGCMYMPPEQFLTIFEDELDIKLDTSEWDGFSKEDNYNKDGSIKDFPKVYFKIKNVNMSNEGFVHKGDIIKYNGTEKTFMSQVLGLSNAFVQVKFLTGKTFYETLNNELEYIKGLNSKDRYGIVLKLSENNPFSGNKKVVLFGNPVFGEPVEVDGKNHYMVDSVYFNIKAIPRIKSHIALRAIYSEQFKNICIKKFNALDILIGPGFSNKTFYYKTKKLLSDLIETFNNIYNACNDVLKAMQENDLLYNDHHWVALNKYANKFINYFKDERPIPYKQLDFFYYDWHKRNDLLFSQLKDKTTMENEIRKLKDKFMVYYSEWYDWLLEEIAIDTSTEHYDTILNDDESALKTVELKNAYKDLIEADKVLFETMLPNRAFLISPLPEDLFMRDPYVIKNGTSYSLLTGQDEFDSILEYTVNEFDDRLALSKNEIFAKSGLVQNCMNYSCDAWNFGALNTATIVETHWDPDKDEYVTCDVVDEKNKVDFIDDYYHSSEKWVKKYFCNFADVLGFELDKDYDLFLTKEEYNALEDQHLKEEHYYFDETDNKYWMEKVKAKKLPYWKINEKVQEIYDKDTNQHKFAYADPNMMEMFLEDEDFD